MAVLDTLVEVLTPYVPEASRPIQPEARLDSLGLASLDVLQAVFDLENKLKIELPDALVDSIADKTVAEVAAVVSSLVDGTWQANA